MCGIFWWAASAEGRAERAVRRRRGPGAAAAGGGGDFAADSQGETMEQPRRRRLAAIFIPVVVGLSGLLGLFNRPRFQTYHTVDVVELLAIGMCFGIVLAGLLRFFRGPVDG